MVLVGAIPNMEDLVCILGCNHASLPMKYLSLPLGAKFKETTIWNPNTEKMERRLSRWKRLYLSKGSKVTHLFPFVVSYSGWSGSTVGKSTERFSLERDGRGGV
jgi:hypothetical protein